MGKWVEEDPHRMLMRKIKGLFYETQRKMKTEHPENNMSFDQFAEHFDSKDRFTRRLFEFLVKETSIRAREKQLADTANAVSASLQHYSFLGSSLGQDQPSSDTEEDEHNPSAAMYGPIESESEFIEDETPPSSLSVPNDMPPPPGTTFQLSVLEGSSGMNLAITSGGAGLGSNISAVTSLMLAAINAATAAQTGSTLSAPSPLPPASPSP
mmetsp:Transcript_9769/g.16999  ORF Transcript_9769/g.16999 Transcript_9769/m.16999 type:complete len:211 (+) Transcript_9769:106-738(+)|eukprot:CAMPEP_0196657234 /NCGR_PEP_ID=MMETSP1086-20130531/22526_1 /TAXON_ID=77921 /ORGANISM="Cyanoptyche  gloeocystis , Strain SAG4.97" /LENGTH=210 /DNA_ID=CAMNT_0041990287 /DNA_START=102 /DNA_END=734 /DNA_ORIENTATION=-